MHKNLIIVLLFLVACGPAKQFEEVDLQGHRGARGLWPENSIPGFINVLDLGVNTLEMDLAVTADSQLLVSHEPYFSSEICLTPDGEEISETKQLKLNIYSMTYDQIRSFDCGSKPHPRFPDQAKMEVSKPLLSKVIDTVEAVIKERSLDTIRYNIEIKSSVPSDDVYHPTPKVFSDLVFEFIDGKIDWSRVTIQSFDFRVLQYFNKTYPNVQLALLIENDLSWKENLDSLGFTPDIYSCDYMLLSRRIVSKMQKKKMLVIPWTVNERADMDQLLKWRVDGIITDYPDRTK